MAANKYKWMIILNTIWAAALLIITIGILFGFGMIFGMGLAKMLIMAV